MKSIKSLVIPKNLRQILDKEGHWEDESFKPILIMIEEIQFRNEDTISFQAEFEVLDEYEEINGGEWEEIIRFYIEEKEPELSNKVKGDSENSTCVIWTNNESDFKRILDRMIELITNKKEMDRIIKKKACS